MGYPLIDGAAPEDQPWRRTAKPWEIEAYFDKIFTEIETLVTVPVPMPRESGGWNHQILPYQFPKGSVSGEHHERIGLQLLTEDS
jgi:hypothetical protein